MAAYIIAACIAIVGIALIIYARLTDSTDNYDALFYFICGVAALASSAILAIATYLVRWFL